MGRQMAEAMTALQALLADQNANIKVRCRTTVAAGAAGCRPTAWQHYFSAELLGLHCLKCATAGGLQRQASGTALHALLHASAR